MRRCRGWLGLPLLSLLLLWPLSGYSHGACGAGGTTPVYRLAGQGVEGRAPTGRVTIEAVVTAVFLGREQLNGFFVQGVEVAPDGLPSGLFVYAPGLDGEDEQAVEVGSRLRLTGQSGEFKGRAQLQRLESVTLCGTAAVDSLAVAWPVAEPERLEGVDVTVTTPLVVTGNSQLDRRGVLELTPQRRAFRPTNFRPGDGPKDPALVGRGLLLDNGSYRWAPDPVPYLDAEQTRRVGTTVEALRGVLTYAFEQWRLHPSVAPRFRRSHPRPQALPPPGEAVVRVAAFNLENYFLTLGQRGAANRAELALQRAKLLAAVANLNADLLALSEVENRSDVPRQLVAELAAASGAPWRLLSGGEGGGDAIKQAIAYRADRLEPLGAAHSDPHPVHQRPPLIGAFQPRGGGAPFAVAAIHFKSKVGCPDGGDIDRGQGCWNQRRVEQAEALIAFIGQWRQSHGEIPVLIAGDLNAYGGEDPPSVLAAAGKVDLLAAHVPWPQRYTYVFRGESGYLDHLQAHRCLADRVAAVYTVAINADEPPFLHYGARQPPTGYRRSDAYRSSDHDPLAVDLRVAAPPCDTAGR